jgi:hypothetical protein
MLEVAISWNGDNNSGWIDLSCTPVDSLINQLTKMILVLSWRFRSVSYRKCSSCSVVHQTRAWLPQSRVFWLSASVSLHSRACFACVCVCVCTHTTKIYSHRHCSNFFPYDYWSSQDKAAEGKGEKPNWFFFLFATCRIFSFGARFDLFFEFQTAELIKAHAFQIITRRINFQAHFFPFPWILICLVQFYLSIHRNNFRRFEF